MFRPSSRLYGPLGCPFSLLAVVALVAVLILPLVLAACQAKAPAGGDQPANAAPAMDPVAHGKYLVTTAGCNDCHTPLMMTDQGPKPDMSLMLSGHPAGSQLPPPPAPSGPWLYSGSADMTAWAGPWGVSFTANLTPDTTTGIGAWTEDMFVQTLRNGKHMGSGRALLPPMPWMWVGQMNDQDLKDIFAYLRTIPPVQNQVPQPLPPAGGGMGGGE